MKVRYRKNGYKKAEIEGEFEGNKKITFGLADYSWRYIKSLTIDELEANRKLLLDQLKPEDRAFIREPWQPKEDRVVWCYTHYYPNLGSASSQRGESYHPVMRQITNGQLTVEQSAKRLASKLLSILKDIDTDEDPSGNKYPRLAQLHGDAFRLLRSQVTQYAITKLEKEWYELEQAVSANEQLGKYLDASGCTANVTIGDCKCSILLRFGLACKHHLIRAFLSDEPIPKSLLHPRWWLHGPTIRYSGWEPSYPQEVEIHYARAAALTSASYTIEQIHKELAPEEKGRFEQQILQLNEQLIKIGEGHKKMQVLPLGKPDPVLRRQVVQRKTHGRADARGLTAAEIAERQVNARDKAEKQAKKARDRAFGNLEGESQGGTTITLAIRSPERPTPRVISPSFLPASTAPPRLQLQRGGAPEEEEQV
jgi:hypothetical protein